MEAGPLPPSVARAPRIVSPVLVGCLLILALLGAFMLTRATSLQADERGVDAQLTHAREHNQQFSGNLRYEHHVYTQLGHDFAVVLRVQKQRRDIMNDDVINDYRDENMPAYQHLYNLYNIEIAANRDIMAQIARLRKAYTTFSDLSTPVLGYASTAEYQASTNTYLADLQLATNDATAADTDIQLVLSDMLEGRPLYVGDDRIAENIRLTAHANEVYTQALGVRAQVDSEQNILENRYTARMQRLEHRSRVLHGTFL
jgi:hypothetical protein